MISSNWLALLSISAAGLVSAQTGYTSLGCWNDNSSSPALRNNENKSFPSLDGTASTRTDSINKCYQTAFQLGHNVFAVQNGACYSMADFIPGGDYARYGTASSCPSDGRGGTLINNVYQITGAANYDPNFTTLPYTSLGCWKDSLTARIMRLLEGDAALDSSYWARTDAITKCYGVAAFRGLNVFGIADGGQCWGALDNVPSGDYSKQGTNSFCPRDGKGLSLVNHVYQIKNSLQAATVLNYTTLPYTSLGCWNEQIISNTRVLPSLEGLLPSTLDGSNYKARIDAVNKCYQAAQSQGHNVFALQDGGQCYSTFDIVPGGYYTRGGTNTYCPVDGRGGSFINNVFQVKGASGPVTDYTNLPYTSLGCWFDTNYLGGGYRALPANEPWLTGTAFATILDGNPRLRSNAINKCYQVASQRGHSVFAVQDGSCYSQLDVVPGGSYTRAGNSSFCRPDGRGAFGINHVYQIKNSGSPVTDYTNLPYTSLGCWLDQNILGGSYRALPSNEVWSTGTAFSTILDGNPVLRSDAINKCYQVAAQQGHSVFAVQDGSCYSQLDIVPGGSYSRFGNFSACRTDGRGGTNVNHVYQIKNSGSPVTDYTNLPYTSLGCWLDGNLMGGSNRAIRGNEGAAFVSILDIPSRIRSDAINKCYQVASQQGHNIFGVQDGACYSQLDMVPGGSYTRFGNFSACRTDGRGGINVNHVYQIKGAAGVTTDYSTLPYTSLGCWLDGNIQGSNRALRNNEGSYVGILDGAFSSRTDAINKCYQVAQLRGHNIFALQFSGQCYSQLDVVGGSYAQLGSAPSCPLDGRGGSNINHVYQIKNATSVFFDWTSLPYSSLGCFMDSGNPVIRALRLNEGLFAVLDGVYQNRTDAINKCYQAALAQGHNVFALQWGGQCYSSFDIIPGGDFARYGVSPFCPTDGKGSTWINHVYRVTSIASKVLTFADLPYASGLPYYSLGCWADVNSPKVLTLQEGTDAILDGSYSTRVNAIHKCYQVAKKRGHNVFGVQNGGQCYSKFDTVPSGAYAQHGASTLCPSHGKGAINANNVYRVVA